MEKYVEIYYDKTNKTQRFILVCAKDCTATIDKKLKERNIPFTNSKFVGRYEPLKEFKKETFKYAEKWQWLNTIDLTKT